MNETRAQVIPFTGTKQTANGARSPEVQAVINKMGASLYSLVNRPVPSTWNDGGVIKQTGISYGAYNKISYRGADGAVMHSCGQAITEMRDKRKHVLNAVEMRCDALGLAIYVSGMSQIERQTRAVKQTVRLSVYQHEKTTPETHWALSAEDLYTKLHHVLVSTYNMLSREYNLAGLTTADLTLSSSHDDLVPSVAINMPG